MILDSLAGLPAFLLYFISSYALILIFSFIYTKITPHCEWTLMKENNASAAIAFVFTLLGYSIPLASASFNSYNLVDFLIWGVIAMVTQIVTYYSVRLYMPKLTQRLNNNELPAGIFLGGCALVTGIINAFSMSY